MLQAEILKLQQAVQQETLPSRVAEAEYFPRKQLTVSPQPLMPIHVSWPNSVSSLGKKSARFTLFIDAAGIVREMVADTHSLPPAMEEAALQAFRQARFSPGMRNGLPVKSILRIEIEFEATAIHQEEPEIIEQKIL